MSTLLAVRDQLIDRYLQPRRRGIVRMAAAPRSPRVRRMLEMAVPFPGAELEPSSLESRVHAVGIGPKNGIGDPSVVVYVTRKIEKERLASSALVPSKIDGVRTDVVESPMARLAACSDARKKRVRPLVGGVSIGRADGPAGTLGTFVRSTRAGDPTGVLVLSNSHVLAPDSGRVQGTEAVQPAADDEGPETIGAVLRATRLTRTVPITTDGAVAQLNADVAFENTICTVGDVAGTLDPAAKMKVEKHGRTSGHSTGIIAAIGITAQVNDPEHDVELTFLDLFRVEQIGADDPPVGKLGDSGSLVVDAASRKGVGLLNAADDLGSFYFAQPIATVLKDLEIKLELR